MEQAVVPSQSRDEGEDVSQPAAAAAASAASKAFMNRMDKRLQRQGPHGVLQLLINHRSLLGGVDWFHEHVDVLFHALQHCCTHPAHVSQVYTITKMDINDMFEENQAVAEIKRHKSNEPSGQDRINVWATNLELQRLYITLGGRIYPVLEDGTLTTDCELALLVARYNPMELDLIRCFYNNASFWRQAVTIKGRSLRYAPPSIHTNWELVVRAIATSHVHAIQRVRYPNCHTVQLAIPRTMATVVTRATVASHVQEQLNRHQIFQIFLGGCSIKTVEPPSSDNPSNVQPLSMLECGVETGAALKQLIASFVGIPTGELLTAYRTCRTMLNSASTAGFVLSPPHQPPSAPDDDDDLRIVDGEHEIFWGQVDSWQQSCRGLSGYMG